MEQIAVFPGSFDPITIGHVDIIRRSLNLFDKIIIAIGYNSNKSGFFPLDKRKIWISQVFSDTQKIIVDHYEGLTIDYCKKVKARYLLRGLRSADDFEYERSIAQMNQAMHPELESVFLFTRPEYTAISSTIVRDIIRHGGDAGKFIPSEINQEEFNNNNDKCR